MLARRTSPVPFLAMAAALAVGGCDKLVANPGSDFGVNVLSPSPMSLVGQITASVHFAVTGCDSFGASVQGGLGSHSINFTQQSDGTFLAAVPVEWLRVEDRTCLDDAMSPLASQAQLTVTCNDAGRTTTAPLFISYGTATRAYAMNLNGGIAQETVQYLFRSADPLVPYAIVPSAVEGNAGLYPVSLMPFFVSDVILQDPLAQPSLAANASGVFVSSSCNTADQYCLVSDIVVSPATTVAGEELWGTSPIGTPPEEFCTWYPPVSVPATVLDLGFEADGTLVVLSEANDNGEPFPPAAAVVTRVVPSACDPGVSQGSASVAVIGYFPNESVQTRFSRAADGQLAFVTFLAPPISLGGPLQSVLHTTDGQTVTSLANPAGTVFLGEVEGEGAYSSESVQLSPDASSLVVSGYQPSLGVINSSFVSLPTVNSYWLNGDRGGAVWLPNAIALWSGSSFIWRLGSSVDVGSVEVFDTAAPNARIYSYAVHPLPGGSAVAQLYGATAVGNNLILTTNTGVRVLGPDGTVIGGADPLPCGLEPTALAVPAGTTTFAVGAGDYVYVFDLAEAN